MAVIVIPPHGIRHPLQPPVPLRPAGQCAAALAAEPLRDRRPGTKPQPFRGMSGFCIGMWREDFEKVNGFDGRYCGYGAEDWDILARLQNAGIHAGYLPRQATVMHLWHRETSPNTDSPGYQLLRNVEQEGVVCAKQGLREMENTVNSAGAIR